MDDLAIKLYTSIKKADEQREMEMWHASSLAQCSRAQYFKRKGVAPLNDVGAGKILRWKAGHLMEEAIRPFLQDSYPKLKSNERLENKELDLTGEYDNYDPVSKTIFEIKSVHQFAFLNKKKADERFHLRDQQPYLHHRVQNHSYVKLLDDEPEKITYVYITLDGRIATYSEDVNPQVMEVVDAKLAELNNAWQTQTPPACTCVEGDMFYKGVNQYCDYKEDDTCCDLSLLESHNE